MPPFFEKAQKALPLSFRIDVKIEAAEPSHRFEHGITDDQSALYQDAEKSFSFFFPAVFFLLLANWQSVCDLV